MKILPRVSEWRPIRDWDYDPRTHVSAKTETAARNSACTILDNRHNLVFPRIVRRRISHSAISAGDWHGSDERAQRALDHAGSRTRRCRRCAVLDPTKAQGRAVAGLFVVLVPVDAQ
jgi:hypothetical protein